MSQPIPAEITAAAVELAKLDDADLIAKCLYVFHKNMRHMHMAMFGAWIIEQLADYHPCLSRDCEHENHLQCGETLMRDCIEDQHAKDRKDETNTESNS